MNFMTRTVTAKGFHDVTDELRDAPFAGELTIELLHNAINTVRASDGESVGMFYIQYHISAFKDAVPASQRVQFFAAHLDNPAIVQAILLTNIFDSFEPEGLEQLVRDITSRHPMPDCTWIRIVGSNHRVSDKVITECIKMQLDAKRFNVEQSRPFAESFLRHGSGSRMVESRAYLDYEGDPYLEFYDQSPAWCKVLDDDFADIIEACVRRAPEVMFMPGSYDNPELHQRLRAVRPGAVSRRGPYLSTVPECMMTHTNVRRLRHIAANNLRTLKDLSVDMLMGLPLAYQKDIIKRSLPGSLEFLVKATLHYDDNETDAEQRVRSSFFRDCYPKLEIDTTELIVTYRKVYYTILHALRDNSVYRVAMKIDRDLKQLLACHGCYIGKVTSEYSERHGRQTLIRTEINGRKVKIVQNGKQHERFSRDDLIYVDANTDPQFAKWLAEGRTLLFANFHHVSPNMGDNKL